MPPPRTFSWAVILSGVLLPLCAGLSCATLLWWTLPYVPRAVIPLSDGEVYLDYGFLPRGRTLVTARRTTIDRGDGWERSGPVRLWDADTGRLLHSFLEPGASVGRLAYTQDASTIAVQVPGEDRINVFDVASGEPLSTLDVASDKDIQGMSFSQGGRELTYWTHQSERIHTHAWNLSTNAHTFTRDESTGDGDRVLAENGKWRVTQRSAEFGAPEPDAQLVLHDATNGAMIGPFEESQGQTMNAGFSKDSDYFAADYAWNGPGDDPGVAGRAVILWELPSRRLVARFDGMESWKFKSDARLFVASRRRTATRGNNIRIWDLQAGREITSFPNVPASDDSRFPALTDDGNLIISESVLDSESRLPLVLQRLMGKTSAGKSRETVMQFYEVTSGRELARVSEPWDVTDSVGVAVLPRLSPDGQTLAMWCKSGSTPSIKLYDVPPRRPWIRILGWSALLAASVFVACKRLLGKWRGAESAA